MREFIASVIHARKLSGYVQTVYVSHLFCIPGKVWKKRYLPQEAVY